MTYCYCGGDVLPEEVKERWYRRCGVPIYQVYGSTEVGHVTYSKIGVEPSPRAIGFPLKSRECRIVDPVTLAPVETGESGELLVTCSYTMKCYHNKPEETDKTYVQLDGKVGERIKAIVVLKEDARGVGGTELIQWCRERLAAYKVPSYIEFRDMLPKSKVGKLLRREVRDDEIRRITKSKSAIHSQGE